MTDRPAVTRIGRDVFLVVDGDTRAIVYVAGPPGDRWAFSNGQVFRSTSVNSEAGFGVQGSGFGVQSAGFGVRGRNPAVARGGGAHALTAPMPAAVIKVLVAPGAAVSQGAPLVVLEAMKMELPVRALESGTVTAVYCREGDLVQADQVLIEMS